MSLAGFAYLQGDFSIQQTIAIENLPGHTITKSEIAVGANNVTAFLGANYGQTDETGLKLPVLIWPY